MPSPFLGYTREKTIEEMAKYSIDLGGAEINRILYDGDHWNNGDFWNGPIPTSDSESYEIVKEGIRKVFCSRNVIAEVVDRKVDGLLSRNPAINVIREAPVTKENPLSEAEVNRLFGVNNNRKDWWKNKKVLKKLKEAFGRASLEEVVVARLYIPRGLIYFNPETKQLVTKGSTDDEKVKYWLDRIFLHICVNNDAVIIEDPDTKEEAAVYQELMEDGTSYLELAFIRDDGKTILRVYDQEGVPEDFALDIGGRLTMYRPSLRPLINEQMREGNRAINLNKTMQNRNSIAGGFVERIFLDAMPPGQWIKDPNDPEKEIYQVNGNFKLGAGSVNFVQANQYDVKNENGEERTVVGSPSVIHKDPSPPDTFIDAKRDSYQDILEEAGQTHVLISGDASSSGSSREQAREVFKATLLDDEEELNYLIEWITATPLYMASFLAKVPNYMEGFKVEAACFVNAGSVSIGERQEDRESVKAGTMSVETAISRNNIDDPRAEMDKIQIESETNQTVAKNKAEIFTAFLDSGVDRKNAALAAGYSEEEAALLAKVDPEYKKQNKQINPASGVAGQLLDKTENPPNPEGTNQLDQ